MPLAVSLGSWVTLAVGVLAVRLAVVVVVLAVEALTASLGASTDAPGARILFAVGIIKTAVMPTRAPPTLALLALVHSTAAFSPAAVHVVRSFAQPRLATLRDVGAHNVAPLMWERAVPEEDKHNQKRKRMPAATPPVPEEALVLELGATLEELQAAAAAEQEDGADAMGVALAAANEADAQVLLAEEAVERALDELAKATDEAATLRAEAERVAGKMIASAAAHAAAAAVITVSVGDDPHPGFRAKYGAQAPEREGKNRAVPQSAANRTPKAATPRHGSWDKIQSPTTGKAQTRSRSGGAGRPEQPIRAAKAGGATPPSESESAPGDGPSDLNSAFAQAAATCAAASSLPKAVPPPPPRALAP